MIVRRGGPPIDMGPTDGRNWFAEPVLLRPSGGDRRRDRGYRIRRIAGVPPEEYDHLFTAQRGRCWACGQQPVQNARGNAGPEYMRARELAAGRVLICRRCCEAVTQLETVGDRLLQLTSRTPRDAYK